jgi:hypothetical protein
MNVPYLYKSLNRNRCRKLLTQHNLPPVVSAQKYLCKVSKEAFFCC